MGHGLRGVISRVPGRLSRGNQWRLRPAVEGLEGRFLLTIDVSDATIEPNGPGQYFARFEISGVGSVFYNTSDGTAHAPGDYTARAGRQFLPSAISVNFPSLQSFVSKTFTLILSNPVGDTLGRAVATATIPGSAPVHSPGAPRLTLADTAPGSGGLITTRRRPELTGSADPGAPIQLRDESGAVIGTTTTADDGRYAIRPTMPLRVGLHSLQIYEVNGAGDTSNPAPTGPLRVAAVFGDHDGAGRTDIGIYDPAVGVFAYTSALTGRLVVQPFGAPSNHPVPLAGDYDGTARTNIGVYDPTVGPFNRPGTGAFYYSSTVGGPLTIRAFGAPRDRPIPLSGDYDGTGKTNVGVYDPVVGVFSYTSTATGQLVVVPFGAPQDHPIPLSGDYDGTGRTNIGVYDPTVGVFAYLSTLTGELKVVPFGAPQDHPIPLSGDYDGTGKTNIGIYDPKFGVFAYLSTVTGALVVVPFGAPRDRPIPLSGDYDGSGKTNIGVYDPTTGYFYFTSTVDRHLEIVPFGFPGHHPIPLSGNYEAMVAALTAATPAALRAAAPVFQAAAAVPAQVLPDAWVDLTVPRRPRRA